MATVIAVFALLWLAQADTAQQAAARQELQQAGVCARCHVVSVLEWGISGHRKTDTDCRRCHGESRGHVVDERNNVKPDRIPHGAAVAGLCADCHKDGCPKTRNSVDCQKCHHVHALINPGGGSGPKDARLEQLVADWQKFSALASEGDRHMELREWAAARDSYRAALKLVPVSPGVSRKLDLSLRRLNPALPGFETVGDDIDVQTGLARLVVVAGHGIRMVLVPGGEFTAGSDALAGSRPVHTLRVAPFYLAETELTQSQWTAVMGSNPSAHQGAAFPDAGRMPVEKVSWEECGQWLHKLNSRVPGAGFRLPTEAEWEYAARAGSTDAPRGQDLLQAAWLRDNSALQPGSGGVFQQVEAFAPRPCGTRQPNPWGLYDMLGNVWEWCSSLCRSYPYEASDGRESVSAEGLRVLRGGGFADSADSVDPALRHGERPDRRHRWNGLRIARSVPDAPDDAERHK